jgi:hypothetical protein
MGRAKFEGSVAAIAVPGVSESIVEHSFHGRWRSLLKIVKPLRPRARTQSGIHVLRN